MTVIYEKTYRPVHLDVDADLLGRLDQYRSSSMPRSKLIHAAIELYLQHLEKSGARKATWSVFGKK